jgi:16S rRNA C967 or C1407 C5-methylase (RsmB/RsmF family)/NOL1/NOP2/fmu family ribosome biogenesis protein
MQLPASLLASLEGVNGFDKTAFEKVHASGEQVTSVRVNPSKPVTRLAGIPLEELAKIPWTDFGFYQDRRPSFTFDPLFHAGCYYVQEASSMFLEQAFRQCVDLSKPVRVLDLCAAPGGKTTHIHSLLPAGSLLVSNEVIRSRVNILKDQVIKWGCENVLVTRNDPKDFSGLENFFDVIVADAPCSGSGLFRRDPGAMNEWSEQAVQLCSLRQQRILADAWPSLKKDGILIYSTCSFSREENEAITKWILHRFPATQRRLTIMPQWNISESEGGYRFWPDKVSGEGFYLACIQKEEGEPGTVYNRRQRPVQAGKADLDIISSWVKKEGRFFIRNLNSIYAWPEQQTGDFSFLREQLRVIYSGVLIGEMMGKKMVPSHALAMSHLAAGTIKSMALDLQQAIAYLQRKDPGIMPGNKGWQLVSYEDHSLGWVNVLANRVNNYYPGELRIIKDLLTPGKN